MKKWLEKKRTDKKMTQYQVAKLSNMPRTTYSSIEQGRRRPSVKNAMRIATVLGFDWTIFFEKELRETTLKNKEVTK